MSENIVSTWLGSRFHQLHPQLQALHQSGGVLSGTVHIALGRGLAGWIGRRLAAKLGVPLGQPQRDFRVEIRHSPQGLHWDRHFSGGHTMCSLFQPVGQWPEGYWLEQTGPLQLRLSVDIVEGGWYWRPLRLQVYGIPLPLCLLPGLHAGKRIEAGRYGFSVEARLPLLGTVLRYHGLLDMSALPGATPPMPTP